MQTAKSQQPKCPDRQAVLDRVLEVSEPRQIIEVDILFAPRDRRDRPDNRHARLGNWRRLLDWNRGRDRLGVADDPEQLQFALTLGRPRSLWPWFRLLCRFGVRLGSNGGVISVRPERTTYAHVSGGTTTQRGGRRCGV